MLLVLFQVCLLNETESLKIWSMIIGFQIASCSNFQEFSTAAFILEHGLANALTTRIKLQ